ncbi:DUF3892 domain-containing protein [Leptospira wolffii]|uniref:DUF3892 domain-containing protein n=1 Tax=Leptospira wolffii TaxID=409998 RepID=UPI001083F643|nr:DUF3892 domain-containing protein [Leptospira wolffii]TGL52009.1 DUF3892 domain-containing protein [Leptospira wolffii]
MADPNYYVSAVRKDYFKSRIEQLKVSSASSNIESGTFWTRATVRSFIESGYIFYTAYRDSQRTWRKGARITLYGDNFLTTDRDSTDKDNLDNLPEE